MRAVKWGGLAFGGLIVLLFATWSVFKAIGSSNLKKARESLRSRGIPCDLNEIAPPPVPAEDNAAPLYLEAFAKIPERFPESTEGFAQTEPKKELREIFAKQAETFAKLRQARAKKACRFDRDYSLGFTIPLPDVGPTGRTCRFLCLYAEATHADGNAPEAREIIRDAIALADCYRNEPLLICQLIRISCWQTVLQSIDRMATGADAAEWLALLPEVSKFEGMLVPAFRGEIAVTAQLIEDPGKAGEAAEGTSAAIHPYWRLDGARYLLTLGRLSELAAQPVHQIRAEAEAIEREVVDLSMWTSPVRKMLLPAITKVFESQAKLQSRLAVTRTGLGSGETLDPWNGGSLMIDDRRVASAAGLEWKKRS